MGTQKVKLDISGMHCASCSLLIDDTLEDLLGVTSSQTNLRKKRCEVSFDSEQISLDTIIVEIKELGYTAVLP